MLMGRSCVSAGNFLNPMGAEKVPLTVRKYVPVFVTVSVHSVRCVTSTDHQGHRGFRV
jgi:hypothetical protein